MNKDKAFKVVFEDIEVVVQQSLEEFSFIQFDAWVRSRFGFTQSDKIVYYDAQQKEVLLSKSYIVGNDRISVVVERAAKTKSKANTSKPFSYWSLLDPMFFYMAVPFLIVAAGIYTDSPIARWIPVINLCQHLDDYLMTQGVIQKSGVSVEAVIAYVCWSTTYLFVRRLWNPETSRGALQKFAADSFYGGLAAAGAVILKAYLAANLVNRTHG